MSCVINFFNENLSYVIRRKAELRKWIIDAIEKECKVCGDINFILCSDAFLKDLNYKYLNHKTLTDILTFSFSNVDRLICGDIYISLPRVRENAIKYHQKFEDELHRVMIHGILHLTGYNDSSKSDKIIMTKKENLYLALL